MRGGSYMDGYKGSGRRTYKTRKRILAFFLMFFVAMSTVFGQSGLFYAEAATPPNAGASSANRTGVTTGNVWVYSDTAGAVWYIVDEIPGESSTLSANEIISSGTNGGNVAADSISGIAISKGMYEGKKYVHLTVADSADASNVSPVFTIALPETYMYFESFEAYPENYNKSAAAFGFNENQKIVDDSGDKVCKMYGGGPTIGVTTGQAGGADTMILETKIKTGADTPGFALGWGAYWHRGYEDWTTQYLVGVHVEAGIWKSMIYDPAQGKTVSTALDQCTESVVKNTWYTVRLVYDTAANQFDVYINDRKANSEPLTGCGSFSDRDYRAVRAHQIMIGSSTGQDTYCNDISFVSYPTPTVSDARVAFSVPTANYTKAQNVELSTGVERTIYYTTDGSYPNPTANGTAATKKYTAPIPVSTNTTIRAVAGTGEGNTFRADSVAYSETYGFIEKPTAAVSGIYRSSATAVEMRILSDIAGEVYYMIGTKEDAVPTADDILQKGIASGFSLAQNTTGKLSIASKLSAGDRNVYLVVKEKDGTTSEVQTVRLPENIWFYEDFEGYPEGAVSGESFFGLDANRVTETLDGDKAYKITNYVSAWAGAARSERIRIAEADIRVQVNDATTLFGINHRSGMNAGVMIQEGEWKTQDLKNGIVDLDQISEKAQKDRWYNVRIVWDTTLMQYDVYIDGVRANSTPIAADISYDDNRLYMESSAGQSTYFDNIKYYSPTTDTRNVVSYSPATAAYTTDQQVELTTLLPGREIYYTTDGTLPDLTVNAASVKKYDADKKLTVPFSEAPVTVQTIAGYTDEKGVFKAESLFYSETYRFYASPTLKGQSIYRYGANAASLFFASNVAGDVFYYVTADPVKIAAGDENYKWIDAKQTAEQDKTTRLEVSGLGTGAKYVTVYVRDKDGTCSNSIQYYLPYDVCVLEDFDGYPEDAASGNAIFALDNSANKKISSLGGNQVFAIQNGGYSYLSSNHYRKELSYDRNAAWVFDARVRFDGNLPTADFWQSDMGLYVKDGVWYIRANGKNEDAEPDYAVGKAVKDTWYELRYVFDKSRQIFDVYIDGKKVNREPVSSSVGNWDLYFGSSAGLTVYVDDVVYYSLPKTNVSADVVYDPSVENYTVEQKIALSAKGGNKTIYYTLDGSYPDPVNNAENTKKYDPENPFSISSDTTVRAIAGTGEGAGFLAESVAIDKSYRFFAKPVLKGESINRNAAAASVRFVSNVGGTIYYLVTDTAEAPSGEELILPENIPTESWSNRVKLSGDEIGKVQENVFAAFTVNRKMSTGRKYLHFTVVDKDGVCSEIQTIPMPYDYYACEDFEFLPDGYGSGAQMDGSYYYQAPMYMTVDEAGNRIYRIQNSWGQPGMNASQSNQADTCVFEARIKSTDENATGYIGFASGDERWAASVGFENGAWKGVAQSGAVLYHDLPNAPAYKKDTWYRVRIVFDQSSLLFDVYIDGKKANDQPLTGYDYVGTVKTRTNNTSNLYIDDVEYMCMDKTSDTQNSIVKFSKPSASYSKAQQIALTTAFGDRVIYYTTDGSCPDPVGNAEATKRYTEPVSVAADTTIRAIAGTVETVDGKEMFKAESLPTEASYKIIGKPTITGNSLYRTKADSAVVRFLSDVAGEAYYLTSNTKISPTPEEVVGGVKAEAAVSPDATYILTVDKEISAVTKFIYVVVKDENDVISNVLEYEMPYEACFAEGFDAYAQRKLTGADTYNHLVAGDNNFIDDTDGSRLLALYSSTGEAYAIQSFPSIRTGKLVAEARIKTDTSNPTFDFAIGTYSKCTVGAVNGTWKSHSNGTDRMADLDSVSGVCEKDKWYSLRIEHDIDASTYDVYIDGAKANSTPIEATFEGNRYEHEISLKTAKGQTLYVDDTRLYLDTAEIKKEGAPSVKKGLVYDGSEQTGINFDASETAGYVMSGTTTATAAGSYTATATLKARYRWADGTTAAKTFRWSIAPKEVTMTADVQNQEYAGGDSIATTVKAKEELTGLVPADQETYGITLSENSKKEIPATFVDVYAGTGKEAEIDDKGFAFTLAVGEGKEDAVLKNYKLLQPVLKGDILPIAQTLTVRRTIPAAEGQTIPVAALKNAVAGAMGILSYEIEDGKTEASFDAETGLVLGKDMKTSLVTVRVKAGAFDADGDGTPEYKAEDTGVLVRVLVRNESKELQTVSFAKDTIKINYGDTVESQTAVNDKTDGGAITYTSSDDTIATVDAATGKVTVVGTGTVVITARAAETDQYEADMASYTIVIGELARTAPVIGARNATGQSAKDGSITGLDSTMEYKPAGSSTYIPITDAMLTNGALTNLAPGVYNVRYAADGKYKASSDAVVVVSVTTPAPAPTPAPVVVDEDISKTIPYAENIPVVKKETVIKTTNTDKKDVEGSTNQYLMLKGVPKGKTKITLTWKKINGADGYIIYGSKCGSAMTKQITLASGSKKKYVVSMVDGKKLKKGTYYKFTVVAYKKTATGEKVITTSKSVHVVTDGGKNGNPTKIKVKKSKLTVKKKKTVKIKASLTSKKKVRTHIAKFRYESANPAIATVNKSGKVKGIKAGKVKIYVYTQNGLMKTVTVTVK